MEFLIFGFYWDLLGFIFGGFVLFLAVRGVSVDTKRASVKMGNAKSAQKCDKSAHFCAQIWYKIGTNARLFGILNFKTCAFDSKQAFGLGALESACGESPTESRTVEHGIFPVLFGHVVRGA